MLPSPNRLLFSLLLLFAPHAHASTITTDCTTDGDALYCRLVGILHILDGLAVILGVVLVIIAVFAYAIYRRNRNRRLDRSPEAKTRRP